MIKTDGIIFDIDGTIWNTTKIVSKAWNKAQKNLGLDCAIITPKVLQKEFGKPMTEIADDLWPTLESPIREKLLKECCTLEQKEITNNTTDITYPNIKTTIMELSKSFPIFVVSNCQKGYIELTMQKTSLAPFIKDFECFGNTGKIKAQNITLLCKRNNLKNAIYIGDTQGDFEASKKAGVNFIWASYGFGNISAPCTKISTPQELLTLF